MLHSHRIDGGDRESPVLLTRNHGTDESIGINSLISGTKIMLALAIDVLGGNID